MDNLSTAIGKWIQEQRKKKGLSLVRLAELTSLTHGQLSRIENGLSSITLLSYVRICHALGWTYLTLYEIEELELGSFSPGMFDETEDFPALTIGDIEAFVEMDHKWPARAEGVLKDLLGLFVSKLEDPAAFEAKRPFDLLKLTGRSVSSLEEGLGYPLDIPLETLRRIYMGGGLLIMRDLGAYIRQVRQANAVSLRELGETVDLSHPGLSRFETHMSERIRLVDVIRIDRALDLKGELIAFAWRVGELYVGVFRMANQRTWGVKQPTSWSEDEILRIEQIVAVSRLFQHYLPDDKSWLDHFRKVVGLPV